MSFVPALVVTDGGPPPYATTYLSLFVYRNAFEYLRYGYAAAATLVMLVLTVAAVSSSGACCAAGAERGRGTLPAVPRTAWPEESMLG